MLSLASRLLGATLKGPCNAHQGSTKIAAIELWHRQPGPWAARHAPANTQACPALCYLLALASGRSGGCSGGRLLPFSSSSGGGGRRRSDRLRARRCGALKHFQGDWGALSALRRGSASGTATRPRPGRRARAPGPGLAAKLLECRKLKPKVHRSGLPRRCGGTTHQAPHSRHSRHVPLLTPAHGCVQPLSKNVYEADALPLSYKGAITLQCPRRGSNSRPSAMHGCDPQGS